MKSSTKNLSSLVNSSWVTVGGHVRPTNLSGKQQHYNLVLRRSHLGTNGRIRFWGDIRTLENHGFPPHALMLQDVDLPRCPCMCPGSTLKKRKFSSRRHFRSRLCKNAFLYIRMVYREPISQKNVLRGEQASFRPILRDLRLGKTACWRPHYFIKQSLF